MFNKKCFSVVMIAIGMGAAGIAAAKSDLTIINNTNYDSTSIINNGACSTILGDSGITRAHSTNVVSAMKIAMACFTNPANCKADVYMTANCSGPVVATVIFDTKTGIKSKTVYDQSFVLTGGGFHIILDGGGR